MPLYEYKCSECDNEFTKSSSIADRKEPCESPCPECGEETVTQKLSFAAIADPVSLGHIKPEAGFNQVLRNIKNGNKGSNINIRD